MKCTECGGVFDRTNCLCVDYNDPAKSFGCPHCGVFYMRDLSDDEKPKSIKQFVLALGVFMPSGLMLGQTFNSENPSLMFLSSLVFGSALFLFFEPEMNFLKKWKPSGYKRDLS